MASRLEGADTALAALQALSDVQSAQVLRSAVRAAGQPILDEMRIRVPSPGKGTELHRTYKGRLVAPGFLSRNLRFVVTRIKKAGAIDGIFGVRKEAFYGLTFVERGTVKMAAHKWFVVSIEAAAERSVKIFGDTITARLKAIASKYGGGSGK